MIDSNNKICVIFFIFYKNKALDNGLFRFIEL